MPLFKRVMSFLVDVRKNLILEELRGVIHATDTVDN